MSIAIAREHPREQQRISDLMRLVPPNLARALDVGARDGYLASRLANMVSEVVAVDLQLPKCSDPRVLLESGDARRLRFEERSFDLVLCAEVLEHIPEPGMTEACRELARVTRQFALVGVPFEQDTRVGRTTCHACGTRNPPWGHVNSFDRRRLEALFPEMVPVKWSFVGTSRERTNWLAAALNDFAGNPWGTYEQDEPCIKCGSKLVRPMERSIVQRGVSKVAFLLDRSLSPFVRSRPSWVHVLFQKRVS